MHRSLRVCWRSVITLILFALVSCDEPSGIDANVTTLGTVEVTAQLVEIPPGAIFKRNLYDYATILKYKVLKVHRGNVDTDTIFVAHYNPFKSRRDAADRYVKGIGGNLTRSQAGAIHRMAMEVPLDDFFMGAVVNKYFGQDTNPIYWALWTNAARHPDSQP